jgi:hypothetical protein
MVDIITGQYGRNLPAISHTKFWNILSSDPVADIRKRTDRQTDGRTDMTFDKPVQVPQCTVILKSVQPSASYWMILQNVFFYLREKDKFEKKKILYFVLICEKHFLIILTIIGNHNFGKSFMKIFWRAKFWDLVTPKCSTSNTVIELSQL